MRLGEVVHLRDAVAEPDAEGTAGAEADQRLHRLEACPLRVLPRIEEAEDARPPVGLEPDREQAERDQDAGAGDERRARRPRDEQHCQQDEYERDRGAEVWLSQDQKAEHAEQQPDRARELAQRPRGRAPT